MPNAISIVPRGWTACVVRPCSPRPKPLCAAVNPADGDALYFVAVGDGSGRHIFSATLAEHNAAVARYLVTRRETLRKAEAP